MLIWPFPLNTVYKGKQGRQIQTDSSKAVASVFFVGVFFACLSARTQTPAFIQWSTQCRQAGGGKKRHALWEYNLATARRADLESQSVLATLSV